ncbi:hypothetical protein MRB53_016190 [Persea americana]|uniref:Uncharacterized protein n=1 Tax=Persea americana TaxID=3435 RepID=A0ACC2M1L3_PERAE|nr:hypothetical protein MRB53_016190 [Persea americana]
MYALAVKYFKLMEDEMDAYEPSMTQNVDTVRINLQIYTQHEADNEVNGLIPSIDISCDPLTSKSKGRITMARRLKPGIEIVKKHPRQYLAQSQRQNPPNLRGETLSTLLSVRENYSSQKPDDEAAALSTLFFNRNSLHPLLQSKPTSFFRDILPKISTKPFSRPSSPFLRNPFWGSLKTTLPSPIKKTDDETLSNLFSVFEKYSSEKLDDDAAIPTRRREVSIVVFPVFSTKLDNVLGDGLFNADDGFTDSSVSGIS